MVEGAQWVQAEEGQGSPLFRREFRLGFRPVSARMRICGLGFFELYLNGEKVSEDVLAPAWTDYEPREMKNMLYPINDTFSHRIYYMEYEVGEHLREGANAVGVWLGNGWYCQNRRVIEGDFRYGCPKLLFELTVTGPAGEEARLLSDTGMKWHPSEITATNMYYGETHDLRRRLTGFSEAGFDDSGWNPVAVAAEPKTRLLRQECPADRVIRRLRPTLVYAEGDRRIFDCGENLSGYVVLEVPGDEGAVVTVTHSEELNADKTALDVFSAGGHCTASDGESQIQTDTYICGSRPARVHPRFTWYGFRFFEVKGKAEVIEAAVVHGDFSVTSSFACSDDSLNWLYEAYLRSQLTNIHCGVPSDCPHRERLGYTGDGQATAEAAMLTLDVRKLYEKWMEDIVDGQDPVTGHVQHTAPFYGGGGGPGGWGGAVYRIPTLYTRMYGDTAFLRRYYPAMRLWLEYMESRSENGLVVREEEGGWCLGDWTGDHCPPENPMMPEPYVNTYYYIQGLRAVMEAARMLEIEEDIASLKAREDRCVAAIKEAYYDEATGSFCGGARGADAFAVDLGLGDARTLQGLVDRYRGKDSLDTGIFATDILVDLLFRHGQGELARRLIGTSVKPMRDCGNGTLWETWTGMYSHNHPMYGAMVRSLFTHVLGIRQKPGSTGFEQVEIAPADIPGLDWAEGHITVPRGRIAVRYRREKDGRLRVESEMS